MTDDARTRMWTASRRATRILSGERPRTMAERLTALAASPLADGRPDAYGDGVVEVLERRVADLLGKPAALWFPTGTMAQQAVLRVWAERAGTSRVVLHPQHHTQVHEEDAGRLLTGLDPVFPTTEPRHPTAAELTATPGPLAAVALELPLQELGYLLPTWDEYVAVTDAAHDRGLPVHLDGARLWESTRHLGHPLAEIAARADSVYVSFYKAFGGLSGAVVVAEADVVEALRPWRVRYGGNVYMQFPAVLAALDGLDARLDRLDAWVDHATVVARALDQLPELHLTPFPPHIEQFSVRADVPADALNAAVLADLEATGERWVYGWSDDGHGGAAGEVTIGDAGLAWSADDVVTVGRRILDRALATEVPAS